MAVFTSATRVAAVLLGFSTFAHGLSIPESSHDAAVQDKRDTASLYTAYLSAYSYPNVVYSVDNGAGDPSKLDEIYLFAVNMTKALTPNAAATPLHPAYEFSEFLYTYNNAKFDTLSGFDYSQAVMSPGPAQIPNKAGIVTAMGLKSSALVIPCFGGWMTDANTAFVRFSKDSDSQQAFARGVANFVSTNGYDGADLDWEYPAGDYGGATATVQDYLGLLTALRAAFKELNDGKTYKISIAVPSYSKLTQATDITATIGADSGVVKSFNDAVDAFHVMAYDSYNGVSTSMGGHSGKGVWLDTLKYLVGTLQMDVSKIIIGAPTYARYWPIAGNCPAYQVTADGPPPTACALTPMPGGYADPAPTVAGALAFNYHFSVENNGWNPTGWFALWKTWQEGVPDGKSSYTSADGYHWFYSAAGTSPATYFTWTTPADISLACKSIATDYKVAGFFGFSLHQDTISATSPVVDQPDTGAPPNNLATQSMGGASGIFNALAACAGQGT